MKRRVKDFVDFPSSSSLRALIEELIELRDRLPDEAEAELTIRGDERSGHRLTISYFREQTDEETRTEEDLRRASK